MLTVLSTVIFTDVFADSFVVNFDKQFYDVGDSLTISGEILEIGMPVIAMSIYDPNGKILSANNLEISPEKTFTKTIFLDSPFYEKIGEYEVKLNYGQISEHHYFIIGNEFLESEISIENSEEPEIILLYTDQKQYADKDVIKITGLVSTLDSSTVLIGIYDPFGMPAGFYFGPVDSNLEFTTSFLVKDGVNFRIDGTYSIKAHYAKTEATSFFDYSKKPQIIIEESTDHLSEDNIKESEHEDKKTNQSTNENYFDTENISPSKKLTDDDLLDDSTSIVDHSEINNPTNIESDDNIAITNILVNATIEKTKYFEDKETKIIKDKNLPRNNFEKQNNLTVDDVELGKLLNQITLECDSSTYTDTISYYDGMGPALYRLCKFDSSLNFFNDSLINNPNDVEILVNKGSTLGKLGYFSEAIIYYDHAINIDPTFLPAKNNKANALANLGIFDDAILLYDEILEQNPNYLTARKNLNTVLSLDSNLSDISSEFNIENVSYPKLALFEKIDAVNPEKQKTSNFFDEISIAFSTLGSLFGFLN